MMGNWSEIMGQRVRLWVNRVRLWWGKWDEGALE